MAADHLLASDIFKAILANYLELVRVRYFRLLQFSASYVPVLANCNTVIQPTWLHGIFHANNTVHPINGIGSS